MTLTISNIQCKYAKCVSSLLFKVQKKGIKLDSVDDGGEVITLRHAKDLDARTDAVDTVCSVDESYVRVTIGPEYEETRGFLFIVLGNDKSEILADYGITKGQKEQGARLMKLLDEVADEFYEQWG